jgi:hypothetical protein
VAAGAEILHAGDKEAAHGLEHVHFEADGGGAEIDVQVEAGHEVVEGNGCGVIGRDILIAGNGAEFAAGGGEGAAAGHAALGARGLAGHLGGIGLAAGGLALGHGLVGHAVVAAPFGPGAATEDLAADAGMAFHGGLLSDRTYVLFQGQDSTGAEKEQGVGGAIVHNCERLGAGARRAGAALA